MRTSYHIDLAEALLGAIVCIGQVHTLLERTAHDLEVRDLTDMWLHSALEKVETHGSGSIGRYLYALRCDGERRLGDAWCYIAQEGHRTTYTHILECANAENGVHIAEDDTLAHALHDLLLVERPLLKEGLHQVLLVLSS